MINSRVALVAAVFVAASLVFEIGMGKSSLRGVGTFSREGGPVKFWLAIAVKVLILIGILALVFFPRNSI